MYQRYIIRLTSAAHRFALFRSSTFSRVSADRMLNRCVNLVDMHVRVFRDTDSHRRQELEKVRNDVLELNVACT